MEGLLLLAKATNDPASIRRFTLDARALLGAGAMTVATTDRTGAPRRTAR